MTRRLKFALALLAMMLIIPVSLWMQFLVAPYLSAMRNNSELVESLVWPDRDSMLTYCVNGAAFVYVKHYVDAGKTLRLGSITGGRRSTREVPHLGATQVCSNRSENEIPVLASYYDFESLMESGSSSFTIKSIFLTDYSINQRENWLDLSSEWDFQELAVKHIGSKWFLAEHDRRSDNDGKVLNELLLISIEPGLVRRIPVEAANLQGLAVVGDNIIYRKMSESDADKSSGFFAYSMESGFSTRLRENMSNWDPVAFSVYGNIFVWSDLEAKRLDISLGDWLRAERDIFFYDFAKQQGGRLISEPGVQDYPFIYKENIFWADKKDIYSGYDIRVKNLRTGESKLVVGGDRDQTHPIWHDGYLYWSEEVPSGLLWLLGFRVGSESGQQYIFRKKMPLH